jgi:putative Mg2+ transporter-C (MgtC) family protein
MPFVDLMERLDLADDLARVGRLVLAMLLGAMLGWDRERHDKPAGLRTHVLVSLGSASFVGLAGDLQTGPGGHAIDPTRVLQGVVGGLGFLGAGTIIQGRGQHVSGLTTAASVWVVGAVGAAAGLGSYAIAIATAVLALPVLAMLGKVEATVNPNAEAKERDEAKEGADGEATAKRPKMPEPPSS